MWAIYPIQYDVIIINFAVCITIFWMDNDNKLFYEQNGQFFSFVNVCSLICINTLSEIIVVPSTVYDISFVANQTHLNVQI